MDLRLTAMIAKAHVQLRQEMLSQYPHLIDEQREVARYGNRYQRFGDRIMATPILQGLGQMLAKLEHNLEAAASPLARKIASVESVGLEAIKRAHVKVDGIGSRVREIEGYVAAVISNGGGDPLDGSSNSSEKPGTGTTTETAVKPDPTSPAAAVIEQTVETLVPPAAETPAAAPTDGEPDHLTVNGVQQP